MLEAIGQGILTGLVLATFIGPIFFCSCGSRPKGETSKVLPTLPLVLLLVIS
jgi:hypothetical protein